MRREGKERKKVVFDAINTYCQVIFMLFSYKTKASIKTEREREDQFTVGSDQTSVTYFHSRAAVM